MAEKRYICTGSCGGSVSEAEYKAGKTTCGMKDCTKHGQPLVEKEETMESKKDDKKGCICHAILWVAGILMLLAAGFDLVPQYDNLLVFLGIACFIISAAVKKIGKGGGGTCCTK